MPLPSNLRHSRAHRDARARLEETLPRAWILRVPHAWFQTGGVPIYEVMEGCIRLSPPKLRTPPGKTWRAKPVLEWKVLVFGKKRPKVHAKVQVEYIGRPSDKSKPRPSWPDEWSVKDLLR